jgi:hypothetical protein
MISMSQMQFGNIGTQMLPRSAGYRSLKTLASILLLSSLLSLSADAQTSSAETRFTHDSLESATISAQVDSWLDKEIESSGGASADLCSDSTFLRRAYLDLTGTIPNASEVMRFTNDPTANKRALLIDRLLLSPECATHLANIWSTWLLPEGLELQGAGTSGLHNWLRTRFAENLRYDRLVSDLLVATGSTQSGPTAFFVAAELKPEKIAARTARVFMGVQLDCAECHDHPFDRWTQRDFWGFAAYFAQLSDPGELVNPQAGTLSDTDEGEVSIPGEEQPIAPNPLVQTGQSVLSTGTRRQRLTLWLTARENPFLARATVNRVWSLLFGRGLIEPIDDMRAERAATHPELLDDLSNYFASSGYDLRSLLAALANTRAYHRATAQGRGPIPEGSYAAMWHKPLTQEQLGSVLTQVAREVSNDAFAASRYKALNQIGRLRGDASEAQLGIVSALVALHGDLFDSVSREGNSRLLHALEAPHLDADDQLRWLFLSTLSREPTHEESAGMAPLLRFRPAESPKDPEETEGQAMSTEVKGQWQSDLLWALINSTEFAMTP